jgi:hypothetical protein
MLLTKIFLAQDMSWNFGISFSFTTAIRKERIGLHVAALKRNYNSLVKKKST